MKLSDYIKEVLQGMDESDVELYLKLDDNGKVSEHGLQSIAIKLKAVVYNNTDITK